MCNQETSSKEWWRIARSQMGIGKHKYIDSLLIGDDLIIDDELMGTAFNEYFVNEASLKVAQEEETLVSTEVVDAPSHSLNTHAGDK